MPPQVLSEYVVQEAQEPHRTRAELRVEKEELNEASQERDGYPIAGLVNSGSCLCSGDDHP